MRTRAASLFSMTTLRVIGALGARSIRQTFRRPQFLAPILVFPSLLLAINTGGAGAAVNIDGFPQVRGFLDFQLGAALLQSTMMAGLSGGIALALDVEIGFTDRLIAAPISRFALVLGRLAGTGVLGVVAAVYFLAVGLIFGAHIQAGVLGAVLVIALGALSAMAFGSLAAALALKAGQASVVQGFFPLVFVVLFLSTAFFPQQLLLEPAATIAEWNPFSFIVEGIRNPVISTASSRPLFECLIAIAGIGAVGIVLSACALRQRLRTGG